MAKSRSRFHNSAPTAIAVGVGALAFASVLTLGVVGIAKIEERRLNPIHEDAVATVQRMATETMRVLRTAEAEIQPGCNEDSLKALRRLTLSTDIVAELGVRGDGDTVICTTTDGALPHPFHPEPEDVIVVRNGDIIGLSFNKTLIADSGKQLVSTITSTRHFTAVISPPLMKKLTTSGLTSLRMLRPGGGSIRILQNDSNKLWMEDLIPQSLTEDGFKGWRWAPFAYAVSSRVQDTDFIAQSVVSAQEVFGRNKWALGVVLLMSCLAGAFSFAGAYPLARRRFTFGSRVERLLKPENVVCMLQPIVRLDSGEVVGCELLMRLRDGDQVMVPPAIIPTVLKEELTDEFDSAVLERAGADLQKMELPPGFKVAINFFPGTLKSGLARHLLSRHFSMLLKRGVRVAVEVIEEQVNHEITDRVRELEFDGYQVSLDDFGTGYSNLASVKNLAPSYLKVDRSFVRDMEGATVRSSLIPEIIQIARRIEAQVVAEGIENAEQARLLRELGAEFGQGYFFGKPMSLPEFEQLLEAHRATREASNVTAALTFSKSQEARRA